MAQSAALLLLPTREPSKEDRDALQEAARGLTQGNDDLRLAERVARTLCATGYMPLRGIAVTLHERRVILAGRVPSYYLKQIAQATALAVPGVQQVRNDLEVSQASRGHLEARNATPQTQSD